MLIYRIIDICFMVITITRVMDVIQIRLVIGGRIIGLQYFVGQLSAHISRHDPTPLVV